MTSSIVRLAALAALGLLATACHATGRGAPPVSAPASAPAASSSSPAQAKPLWPDNGIAQRRFDAGGNMTMFVEDDHGVRRAWVVSSFAERIDSEHGWAKALDFFSGKVIKVKVGLTEDGHEDQVFTAPDGTFHFDGADPRYPFSGTAWGLNLPGLSFGVDNVLLSGTIDNCYVGLLATGPVTNYETGQKPAARWMKYPIYKTHNPGPKGCPDGFLDSLIGGALDLGDGTFLASEGCFIFRLRKSDLSPVGAAPALRVVDASIVHAAIAKLHGKKVADAAGYLIKALNLPTSPELSCKDD